MIAQAATADALVLVPRGNGELEAGSRGQLPGSVARFRLALAPPPPRAGGEHARAHERAHGPARPVLLRGRDTARSARRRRRRAAPRTAIAASATRTGVVFT